MGHADRFTSAATSSAQALSSDATTAQHRSHSDDTADASQGTAFSRSTGLPVRMGKATEDCKNLRAKAVMHIPTMVAGTAVDVT